MHLLILARHSSPSPSPASYKWKHWTNQFQEPSFMHFHISFLGVCPSDSHWKRWTPNRRTKHNLRWISSHSIHSTLTDQLLQINLGNPAWAADRAYLTHTVLCCIRNCSLLSPRLGVSGSSSMSTEILSLALSSRFLTVLQGNQVNPLSKLYLRSLSFSKNRERSVTWPGDTMICACHHYISKWRLWPFLKVKDPALQITTGNKKSLGSCSYIRINLSIHLKSKQYGLTTLTILENRFGLPENQNIPQSNLFI